MILSNKKNQINYCLIILLVYSACCLSVLWADNIPEINLRSDRLSGFVLEKHNTVRERELYTFVSDDMIVKIEVIAGIDKESAETLIGNEIIGVKALYDNALSPYPGDISNRIVFNEKFRPVLKTINNKAVEYKYFLLFSNKRFGLGVGSDDLVEYKHLLGWFYCSEFSELHTVRCFISDAHSFSVIEDFFLGLTCSE
ncbi:MAG: hypothetical protein P9M03_10360 [Candidatus Theseobacter exili]|nr:hypothetical protein [Candidatus Theseobacter exili]